MSLLDLISRRKSPVANSGANSDFVKVRGYFTIEHKRDGKTLSKQNVDNTVVYVGKYAVANNLIFASIPRMAYMALGTDSTAAAVAQSLLLGELTGANSSGAARVQASVSAVNVSAPTGITDTALFYNRFAIQTSCQIQEVGIFNLSGANNGQLMGRQVVTAINGQSGDTVVVTYKFQF
jgi:hypothetical protein